MTETSQGTKRKTTKTSSFLRHTYGEMRPLNPGIKRLNTATLIHGEQLRHESGRDEGRIRVGCGMKPAEFLKVRTREGISGGVVTNRHMASGDREQELASDENKAMHKMHGQGVPRGTRIDDGYDGMVVTEELDL